jgi:RNA polymerase sigma factor (TIGR02999 family)
MYGRRQRVGGDKMDMECASGQVTSIFAAAGAGDEEAAEKLLTLVYEELRRMAGAQMAREPAGSTLQPTALVHEAWLRLGGDRQQAWKSRAHFFGAAAEAMRRILIDRARKRRVREASGLASPEELHESRIALKAPESELLGLDEVLDGLAQVDPEAARLVKLRYFVGLEMADAAEVMGISLRQAERLWTFAKAWLRDALRRDR